MHIKSDIFVIWPHLVDNLIKGGQMTRKLISLFQKVCDSTVGLKLKAEKKLCVHINNMR